MPGDFTEYFFEMSFHLKCRTWEKKQILKEPSLNLSIRFPKYKSWKIILLDIIGILPFSNINTKPMNALECLVL